MELLKKGTVILIGSVLIAVGINGFLVPVDLLEGGALGISLIIHYLIGARIGLTFLLISIPIFILAWFFYRPFFYNGLHGMLCSSLMIDLFSSAEWLSQLGSFTPLQSALVGGTLIGIGAGIMLRFEVSIGGLDLLAQMLAKKMAVNTGVVILSFDMMVVTVGSIIVHAIPFFLSLLMVFIIGITISMIVAASKRARMKSRVVASE